MSRWEFKNEQSALESAHIEILKGNKVVIFNENGTTIMIIWEKYKD